MFIRRDQNIIWVSGSLTDNRPHKHHALQVTWARPSGFARLLVGKEMLEGACVVIDAGISHSLEMHDGLIALIDSESALATAIRITILNGTQAAVADYHWDREPDELVLEAWAGMVGACGVGLDMDERVVSVLAWLDELEGSGRWYEVTLKEALEQTRLSEGRFLHLFSEQIGTPWRSYLVWRRALVAMTYALQGASLTDSAHAAGWR